MLQILDPKSNERILEVGFGTGATLVQLVTNVKGLHLTGYEISEVMLQKGIKRVNFCGFGDLVNLSLLDEKHRFPAMDKSFDKVYAESVIGIQEKEEIIHFLEEIRRVLKPDGVFVFNETIWKDSTDKKQIIEINKRCKESFGIIQANGEYPFLADWKKLLNSMGFNCELEFNLSKIPKNSLVRVSRRIQWKSLLFSLKGKIKSRLSPSMRKDWSRYQNSILEIMGDRSCLMEGVLIKARKVAK